MVPSTVATNVLTTASTTVFCVATILSWLSSSFPYHWVVNPIHGPPCFAELNEKIITTTIGAYMKMYRKAEITHSGSGSRFTAAHRPSRRRSAHTPTSQPARPPCR